MGVADDGSLPGLGRVDVARLNQLIGNAASQHVRSPLTVHTENIGVGDDRVVIVLTIPKGRDNPCFDRNGVIWLKSGADKRRVNSKEELRRLFQGVDRFHADELPTRAGIDKLDKLRFRDFLRDVYQQPWPDSPDELLTLLQNMNPAADDGMLNLAGVLLSYRGLGSGIERELENWLEIDFPDDRDGCQFTRKSSRKILELIQGDPMVTIAGLAQSVGITDRAIKKQIEKLKAQGRIRRIWPRQGRHWEVVE